MTNDARVQIGAAADSDDAPPAQPPADDTYAPNWYRILYACVGVAVEVAAQGGEPLDTKYVELARDLARKVIDAPPMADNRRTMNRDRMLGLARGQVLAEVALALVLARRVAGPDGPTSPTDTQLCALAREMAATYKTLGAWFPSDNIPSLKVGHDKLTAAIDGSEHATVAAYVAGLGQHDRHAAYNLACYFATAGSRLNCVDAYDAALCFLERALEAQDKRIVDRVLRDPTLTPLLTNRFREVTEIRGRQRDPDEP